MPSSHPQKAIGAILIVCSWSDTLAGEVSLCSMLRGMGRKSVVRWNRPGGETLSLSIITVDNRRNTSLYRGEGEFFSGTGKRKSAIESLSAKGPNKHLLHNWAKQGSLSASMRKRRGGGSLTGKEKKREHDGLAGKGKSGLVRNHIVRGRQKKPNLPDRRKGAALS